MSTYNFQSDDDGLRAARELEAKANAAAAEMKCRLLYEFTGGGTMTSGGKQRAPERSDRLYLCPFGTLEVYLNEGTFGGSHVVRVASNGQ
jgi:hypothetical protein